MVLGGALVGGGVSALAALWGLSDLAGESAAGWGAGAEEACWAELSAPLEDSNALGASGPELVEMATGAAPLFWTGGGSHVLREARRLAEDGYLPARIVPAKTRPRTG